MKACGCYNPPRAQLKKHGFEPTDQWLDHVRLASVRFNSGGSGSFVSPDGLVMTNHHVASDDLAKLTTEKNNYLRDGFHAKTRDQELKCKGLELNVLIDIKDVTAEVEKAVPQGTPPVEAFKLRQAKIAELEKSVANEEKKIRADVVTLYAGGQYHLYTFKQYTDIRIVFAPKSRSRSSAATRTTSSIRLRPRCRVPPRLRERQAAQMRALPVVEPGGQQGGRLVFVSGHPGGRTAQHGRG